MKKWYVFTSEADFDIWHNAKKEELGLPKPALNNNGFINADACETDKVTELYKKDNNDFRALIEESMAENLIESEHPFPSQYA